MLSSRRTGRGAARPEEARRRQGGLARRKSGGTEAGASVDNPGAVTMEMVGRIAGVSQVTVSRALNHPDKVSRQALERINEAIRLTGYVPNLTAASLASRRTNLIAAVVPSITNIVYSSLIQRFTEAIRSAGYQVLLGETGFSQEEEAKLLSNLLSRRPDAVLLTGVRHSAECRRMLLAANIPTVEVWDITDTPIDVCVGFSHSGAGRAVAAFVEKKGYRTAAAVAAGDERAVRRLEAFTSGLSERGYAEPATVRLKGGASIKAGRESLVHLCKNGFCEGVVFCSSDLLAHGILIEANARGMAVPDQIAVIGFGDQDFAAHTYPALTTVKVDRELLGQKAAEALLLRLGGEQGSSHKIDVGFRIVERDSA